MSDPRTALDKFGWLLVFVPKTMFSHLTVSVSGVAGVPLMVIVMSRDAEFRLTHI